MADPGTIGAVVTGLSVLKGYAAYQESYLGAKNLRESAKLTRQYAAQIRAYAQQEAAEIEQAGFLSGISIENQTHFQRIAQRIQAGRTIGALRARAAASGADIGVGAPAQAEYTQRYTAKMQDYLTRAQGARAATVARIDANRQARSALRQADLNARAAEMQAQQMMTQAKTLDKTRGLSVLGGGASGAAQGFQLMNLM